ncbi:AAA family ATPase [Streptomyces sp. NPDC050844]|uniref:ATP-binding protein n=1 Tax=Streptomyces sp. NPDC050844 TaxID=3155790 RepID=UPI0033DE3812
MEETSFIGRRHELSVLRKARTRSRLVTLTGTGGVGKTRIAVRSATEAANEFDDGVCFIDLSGLRHSELLVHAVAAAIGVTDHTTRSQEEALTDHLEDKHLLLVLDTCEHLVEACADLAVLLLRAAPRLHVLATSRQPFPLQDAQQFLVEPMPVVDEAAVLFAQRAREACPGFELTDSNRTEVERICGRLDGIPLAIELAAGRLRTERLDTVGSRLEDRFQVLVEEAAGADPQTSTSGGANRHSTLRTAIGWSHELCRPHERLLWARLSVFAGDFSLDAAQRVCGHSPLGEPEIADLLAGLVTKSLLVRDKWPDGERFRQLDTVRAYGGEWLRRLGEEQSQQSRYLAWCQEFAEQGERAWFGPGQAAVFHAARREHTHLFTALDSALSTPGQEEAGLRLAGTLWFYWVGCGLLGDGRYWLDRALAAASRLTPHRLKALWVTGYVAILQGDSAVAVAMLEDCRAQALRIDDDAAYAYATHRLGCAALIRDEHGVAQKYFEAALARYAALGELNSNVLMARIELAMAFAFQGDLERAVDICEQARHVCDVHGERWGKAYVLYVLSFAAWSRGQSDEAGELARESLSINYAFHDLVGVVLPIEFIALIHASGGHSHHAAVLQGAAHRIWRRVGLPLFGSAHFNAPHDAARTLSRKELGPEDYDMAFTRGTQLSVDQAVALAMGPAPKPL